MTNCQNGKNFTTIVLTMMLYWTSCNDRELGCDIGQYNAKKYCMLIFVIFLRNIISLLCKIWEHCKNQFKIYIYIYNPLKIKYCYYKNAKKSNCQFKCYEQYEIK